ncbi:MAG TPA: hypothetical protein VFW40_07270, partial [Capsulimonadaceae bacterium]|nr:hypothetical protein [Capsulimonadaceae bacterium]
METREGERYAEILVDVEAPHLPQPFTYKIPQRMALSIGDAVLVPFGPSRELIGYVVGVTPVCPPGLEDKVKEIADLIAGANAFDESLWKTARWVSEQTLCELRDALKLIAPELTTARLKTTVRLAEGWQDRIEGVRTPGALALIERLATATAGAMEEPALVKGVEEGSRALGALRRRGVVALE